MSEAIETIATLLKLGANPAFRYQTSSSIRRKLAQEITGYFETESQLSDHFDLIRSLILKFDYRLVAEYVIAWERRDTTSLSHFQEMVNSEDDIYVKRLRYQLSLIRFGKDLAASRRATVSFADQLDDVFSLSGPQLVVYLCDEQYRAPLINLVDEVGDSFGRYIEQQYDLPGANAVVRQGVVRMWHLPDGKPVVSKRENPRKRERFRREQVIYDALLRRIGKQPVILPNSANPCDSITAEVAWPFAVICDGYSGRHYALFPHIEGVSLEDTLLSEQDTGARARLLEHYRSLTDALFDHGVLWGDMSPRNVLMARTDRKITLTLLDFEKSEVLDAPISLDRRIVHCRGQICVEELGVLCLPHEVEQCFKGYFDPSSWDLESQVALPFPPRPEIADILKGRGIVGVTLGEYNRIDNAIINVRKPDNNPVTKERRYPGHLGFKVEQYLSCAGRPDAGDYDRKTTEVLITAQEQGCFDGIVQLLSELTDALEIAFLRAEFLGMLHGRFSSNIVAPQDEIDKLTSALDLFYDAREHRSMYPRLVAQQQLTATG
jgi:hypothetical protein